MVGSLGDALLAAALLEADADGGGVREDVAADRLLGITEHGSRAGVRGDLPACAALELWSLGARRCLAKRLLGGRRDAGARLVGNEDGEVVDGCQLCQPREELVERLLPRRELAAALVVDAEESRRRVDDERAA